MRAIKITRKYPANKRYYEPGSYLVPEEMTALDAKLAPIDGYGEAITEQSEVDKLVATFRRPAAPAGKGSAPEDKSRGSAPENKSEVGKQTSGDSGGDGAELGGARTLTAGGSVKRGARSRGE